MIDTLLAFDTAALLAFTGTCFMLYLVLGADMMFAIASGAAGRPKAAAAVGISADVLVLMAATAAGLGALILTYPQAYDATRYVGAAYLLFLAVQMWRVRPDTDEQQGARRMARAFTRGVVTNILNPKVALFVIAFVLQFTDLAIGPVSHQIVWLGLILCAGGILSDGIIGATAGFASIWLRRASGVMNKLAAVVFGSLAAKLAID